MDKPQAAAPGRPRQNPPITRHDDAVICFIVDQDRIMLIRKLRGLGQGKINGPGGKLEGGESFAAAAIRETQEEIGLVPQEPEHRATLDFTFTDGYHLLVQVFLAFAYSGQPRSSPEAIPLWYQLDAIPYGQMWADDILWLPRVLAGEFVTGTFLFEGDRLLSHQVSSSPIDNARRRART